MRSLLDRVARGTPLSHRNLHSILDVLPTPLSWAELPGGRILFVNRAFRTTFGYPDGHFSTVDDWIDGAYVREEDRRLMRLRWQGLWQKRSTATEISPSELTVQCADGSVCTVVHRGILLPDIGIGIATFEDISDRKRAEDALRRVASEDPLTGLANRRLLKERWGKEVAAADRTGYAIAILVVDLDGFKDINDRWGHEVGDQTLVAFAERLCENVRSIDLVCRTGGDEFVVLLPRLRAAQQVAIVCERLLASLTRPLSAGKHTLTVGATIGASLYPQDGRELDDLLKNADEILYRLKASRKGSWDWFRPSVEP